ncbi:MAG: hypothetical protein IJ497_00435 [Clostridia bacterium]|nr:hypothetical protein [Clostridia bacterium]MBQ8511055.1 hypothetical protein [Clostridia bacterium]
MEKTDRQAYESLVITELMRYVHTHERHCDKLTPESQAVYAMWQLANSDRFKKRPDHLEETVPKPRRIDPSPKLVLDFTAHAHHGEPMTSSPNDRLLYALSSGIPKRHFIINRFSCREVKPNEWL